MDGRLGIFRSKIDISSVIPKGTVVEVVDYLSPQTAVVKIGVETGAPLNGRMLVCDLANEGLFEQVGTTQAVEALQPFPDWIKDRIKKITAVVEATHDGGRLEELMAETDVLVQLYNELGKAKVKRVENE